MDTALGAGRIILDVAEKAVGVIDPLKAVIGDGVDMALGAGGILFDVAGGVSVFGPLKAALGVISTIYGNHKVRLRPSPKVLA